MTPPTNVTPTPGWHVATNDLVAYLGGRVHGVSADSIEAHLVRCEHCRASLAANAPHDGRTQRWEAITREIDRPGRWAAGATWFRLAVGTPHLVSAALVLAALFVAFPLAAGALDDRAAVVWFLALAPSVPIGASLLAYATVADPAGSSGDAAPLHSFRLVVLRTGLLLATVMPLGLVGSALLPAPTTHVLGWFLPAVAACALVLAIGTRWNPTWVAGACAVGWAVVVFAGAAGARHLPTVEVLDRLSVNGPAVQMSSAVLAVAAGAWFVARRDDVTYRVSP